MENVKKLLDEVKKAKGITSDYALAKALNLPKMRISDYYKGKTAPDRCACKKIAASLNKPLDEVIATVEIDREKDEKRREEWRGYLKSIGGMAASFMLAVLTVVTFFVTYPSEALANQRVTAESSTDYKLCAFGYWIRRRVLAVRHMLESAFPRWCFAG